MASNKVIFSAILIALAAYPPLAGDETKKVHNLARPDREFKIFQFPRDRIPRIDGKSSDWDMVPKSYAYGSEELSEVVEGYGKNFDRRDLDIRVRVGWVKGLNRLYFLYEATDDFWDFGRFNPNGYLNDIFEIAVDGDLSGGPFINNPRSKDPIANHFSFKGVHAQNYHIYTPPVDNAWVLVWGCQAWIGEFPQSNYAYSYGFQHGESGRLTLEFWITPYDYAPYEGPENASVTQLKENQLVGLSWAVLDFDGGKRDGFYSLAHNTRMVSDADYLCAFRIMPLEKGLQKKLQSEWSFKVLDMNQRRVAFKDESIGKVSSWKWHFGDGETSEEQNPVHVYKNPGVHYVVTLEVSGPEGKSRRSRFWDVMVR